MRNLARALLRLEEVDLLIVSKELCSDDRWGHGSSSLRDLARVATRCRRLTSADPELEVPVEVPGAGFIGTLCVPRGSVGAWQLCVVEVGAGSDTLL